MSGTIDQKTYLKKFRGAFSLLSPPLDPPMHPHFSRKPSPKARSWPTLVWPVINLGEKSFRHRSERQPLHCFHRSPATGHAFLRLFSCPLSIAQKRVCDTRLACCCQRSTVDATHLLIGCRATLYFATSPNWRTCSVWPTDVELPLAQARNHWGRICPPRKFQNIA